MAVGSILGWSRPFDVHRWSEHQTTTQALDNVFREVVALRTESGRVVRGADEVRKHLRVLLLDLYVAALQQQPGARRARPRWIGISRNKNGYKRVSRYNKLFLSYYYLIRCLDDLIALGYVKQKKGFHDRNTGIGRQTRVRAKSKLLKLMGRHAVLPAVIGRQEAETIILKDANKDEIEYEDTEETIRWRNNLRKINGHLAGLRLRLYIPDAEWPHVNERMERDPYAGPIDYSQCQLRRIFNNSSFREGGRFYGGWWQNIPKKYRKYVTIDWKHTVELDYSGLHIRILYAMVGAQVPDNPYDITAFGRDIQKQAALTVINASEKAEATQSLCKRPVKASC